MHMLVGRVGVSFLGTPHLEPVLAVPLDIVQARLEAVCGHQCAEVDKQGSTNDVNEPDLDATHVGRFSVHHGCHG